jgi:hypothetical protein
LAVGERAPAMMTSESRFTVGHHRVRRHGVEGGDDIEGVVGVRKVFHVTLSQIDLAETGSGHVEQLG